MDDRMMKIDTLLAKEAYNKIPNVLYELIELEITKEADIKSTIHEFSNLYDKLYYYIILKKIPLDKNTINTLELLAMPKSSRSDSEWKQLFDTIHHSQKKNK